MKFIILTSNNCNWCTKAKDLILRKGSQYHEFNLVDYPDLREFLKVSELKTVPQIFVKSHGALEYLGGYNDLEEFLND